MNNFKRIVLPIICLVLCFSFFTVVSYAATNVTDQTSTTAPTTVVEPKVSKFEVTEQGTNFISVAWSSKTPDVKGYRLYKYNVSKKETTLLAEFDSTFNSFKIERLLSGTDYCFKIKAYTKSGNTKVWSAYKTINTFTVLPQVKDLKLDKNSDTQQSLTWTKINGAKGYKIYYLDTKTGKYTLLGRKTENSCSMKCKPATAYSYKVKAYSTVSGGLEINGKASSALATVSKPSKVTGFAASKTTTNSATFSWNSVSKATGYKIYTFNDKTGAYDCVKTVKGKTTETVKDLKKITTYKFKIRAYVTIDGKNTYSDYSSSVYVTTKPEKTTVTQNEDAKNNSSVSVSWTKVSGVKGYLIYVSDHMNSGFTLAKEIKSASTTTAKVGGLTNGKPQYIKIKSYVTVNGVKVYSDFSKILTVYS